MIVVTTPTGAIGRQVLASLIDSDEAIRVIARDPSRLPDRARGRAEVVPGSHRDIDVVSRAFAGADAVLWVVPLNPQASSLDAAFAGFTQAACRAFVSQRVGRVVGVSALGRGTPWAGNAGLVTASLAMDDLIASTGVRYRALTMPAFMENLLGQAEAIRERGMFSSLITGALKLPAVATRDIAAVATSLLLDHSWAGQDSVPLLGPEDLSFDDMARIISEVLGQPVRYHQVPAGSFKGAMTRSGMSEAMAQGMVDMLLAKNEGLDSAEPRTPQSSTPTSFRSWCTEVLGRPSRPGAPRARSL